MKKRVWLLGPACPAIDKAEQLLRSLGEAVAYATVLGSRAEPGEMADGVLGAAPEEVTHIVGAWLPDSVCPEAHLVVPSDETLLGVWPNTPVGQCIAALARAGHLFPTWEQVDLDTPHNREYYGGDWWSGGITHDWSGHKWVVDTAYYRGAAIPEEWYG